MAVNNTVFSTWDVGVAIRRNNPSPLDSTENQTSKTNLEEYAQTGATAYVGQIAKVIEDGTVTGCYIIKNNAGELLELSTKDQLNNAITSLGPVFKFKGVASAIDPDHTTLTVGSGTVGVTVGETTATKNLVSYGTVLQENLDSVKYAWGTSEYPNLFFTDDLYTTENIGQTQYKKGDEEDLQYINVFDTLYFYKPNQDETVNFEIPSQEAGGSPTTGTRIYKVWEALDNGGTLYSLPSEKVNKTLDVYTVTSTAELPTALKTGVSVSTYKYYQFTEIADASKYTVKINNSVNAVTSVTASSENNGHVYQLGEEEYASNGHMWVQLGSPKTDWIVL